MKAQRRHELQTNTLATKIVQLPNLGRIWLGRAAMGLAVIAIIAAFIVSRVQRSHQAEAEAQEFLADASGDIRALQSARPMSTFEPEPLDAKFLARVQTSYDGAKLKLEEAASRSSDKRWLGQAALLRGDMNLALAMIPPLPGASTQPSLATHPGRDEAFGQAGEAYKEVLEKYSDQPVNVISARLGLAAIAEDRKDFKTAKDYYQAVANESSASEMFRTFARRKIDLLATMETPPLIVTSPVKPMATTATSGPSTASSTGPTSVPTTPSK